MIVTDLPGEIRLQTYLNLKIGLPFSSDTRVIGLLRTDLSIAGAVAYNTWLGLCFHAREF